MACCLHYICFLICLRICGFPTSKKKVLFHTNNTDIWHKITIHPTHTTPREKMESTAQPQLKSLLHLGSFFPSISLCGSNFTLFRSLPKRWKSKTRSSLLTSPMTPRFHLKWRSIMIRYVCLIFARTNWCMWHLIFMSVRAYDQGTHWRVQQKDERTLRTF